MTPRFILPQNMHVPPPMTALIVTNFNANFTGVSALLSNAGRLEAVGQAARKVAVARHRARF